jgi:hypothetical protein
MRFDSFQYNDGETISFQGDDVVFVFVNGHLAVDLGRASTRSRPAPSSWTKRPRRSKSAKETPTSWPPSNFRVDTTFAFADCGRVNGVVY